METLLFRNSSEGALPAIRINTQFELRITSGDYFGPLDDKHAALITTPRIISMTFGGLGRRFTAR